MKKLLAVCVARLPSIGLLYIFSVLEYFTVLSPCRARDGRVHYNRALVQ